MKKICVFCGSSKPENNTKLENEVISLGNFILKKKLQLVYGGAKIGLMGLIANTILKGGGYVTGIIPKLLSKKEIINKEVSNLIIVNNMHQRKKKMYDLSDAFIILPGGIGTLEEFSEITTWKILGIENKPIFLLNFDGFYDNLIQQFEVMEKYNFLYSDILKEVIIINSISDLDSFL
ncbi:MAG: TIGR00730 family Rossman fold protein [Bacteroidota bacterium]|nr:TIGR00730 family Rossman fold protein [Bacteroidota bacterium]